jgi:Uncharacterized ABC-type transport system, periplasmic component/surface lipoprotein
MKKALCFILCLSLVTVALFAGGAKENAATETSGAKPYKVALIIENTIDDKGWCQAMHEGIVEAEKQLPGKIEYSYSEKMKPVDAGSIARQYIADGFDLIIAHGAQYKNLIVELAGEYPNVSFAFGTSSEVVGDNVFTYMPESEETGYLSGLIAGLITKSGTVGLVGPVDGGDAARYNRGFVLGVKEVNPSAKILVAHTGSFSDFVKAGELATTQIKNGADVLTGSSQQAIGALRATAEYSNVKWLGQDLAQLSTEEGKAKCVAASSYNYSAVIVGLVESLDNGVKGGRCIPMNFNNNGFIFDYNPALAGSLNQSVKDTVTKALDSFKAKAGVLSNWQSVSYDNL